MTATASRSQRWRVLRRSATFWVGASIIVLIWIFFAIFGDFVTPLQSRWERRPTS